LAVQKSIGVLAEERKNTIIEAESLRKSYGSLEVLRGVDLHIVRGEFVCITGKSGAGKSTLLHLLGTLDRPDSGKLYIRGKLLEGMGSGELALFRNRYMGFVFQFHHLLPEFTALENVMIPALIGRSNQQAAEQKARELLGYLGLSDRLEHKPSQLSGGEQQRVAVARALINNPEIVFADEPSGNLDSASSEELHNLLFSLRNDFGHTFVVVTHNKDLARMSDRELLMQDGKLLS